MVEGKMAITEYGNFFIHLLNSLMIRGEYNMVNETWKDIPGFEGKYQASDMGRIKSLNRNYLKLNKGSMIEAYVIGRVLNYKKKICGAGYYSASLGRVRSVMVHKIIAITFLGPAPSCKHQINHINFNKLDNRSVNLEWVSASDNIQHALRGGRFKHHSEGMSKRFRGENNVKAKLIEKEVLEILNSTLPHKCLAKKYEVSRSTINCIKSGKTWKYLKKSV